MTNLKQYFSGTIAKCLTGIAMMGKTAANRVIPFALNDDGSLKGATTESFIIGTSEFETNAIPGTGIIGAGNLISPYTDAGDAGDALTFANVANNGAIFGANMIVTGVLPSQAYKLYLFSENVTGNFNNGLVTGLSTLDNLIGIIDFSVLASEGTSQASYDGSITNPFSFVCTGTLYGVLQNNDGANITITPGSGFKINLSILSK